MVISYTPSLGKSYSFVNETDAITDVNYKGQTQTTHQKSKTQMDIACKTEDEKMVSMAYTWISEESGTFVNGQYVKDDEENPILGQTLVININREDGKLIDWSGLTDLEYNEGGMDQGDQMANSYASLLFDYFPSEPLKKGSKWEVKNETKTSLEDGGFSTDIRVKSYELQDFVVKNKIKCAKCKITIKIDANSTGTGKDKEGTEYEVTSSGTGEGSGTFFFAYEEGHLVESNYNWIIDFSIKQVNMSTGEKQDMKYYSEQHEKFTLKK